MKIEKTPEADGFVTRWGDSITNYTLEEGLQLLDWLYAHHEWLRGKDDLQAESLLRDFRIEIQQNPVKPFQESDEGIRHALEITKRAQENADKEPWLEDCEHCGGSHLLGTVDMCPLNPNRPEWVKHLEATE